jgi:hypothetical protein
MGLISDCTTLARAGRRFQARLAGLLLAFVWGCERSAPEILNQKLLDGRVVQELLAVDRPTVVLIYDAATCIWCATPLRYWERVARTGNAHVVLLLTGPLRDDDRRTLTIRRIAVGGRLVPVATRGRSESVAVAEYIIEVGKVLASARGVDEIRRRRLWSHPLFTSGLTARASMEPLSAPLWSRLPQPGDATPPGNSSRTVKE